MFVTVSFDNNLFPIRFCHQLFRLLCKPFSDSKEPGEWRNLWKTSRNRWASCKQERICFTWKYSNSIRLRICFRCFFTPNNLKMEIYKKNFSFKLNNVDLEYVSGFSTQTFFFKNGDLQNFQFVFHTKK